MLEQTEQTGHEASLGELFCSKLAEEGDGLMFLTDESNETLMARVKDLTPEAHRTFELFAKEVKALADTQSIVMRVKVVLIATS